MAIHGHSLALTLKDPMEQHLQFRPLGQDLELHLISNETHCRLEPYPSLPSYEKLVDSLLTCRSSKCLVSARRMHISICSNGLESYSGVGNYVVPMFADCGSILEAHQAFNRMHDCNEYSWTSLICGYVQCGQMEYALSLYPQMQENKVCSSPHTLMALLRACAGTWNLDMGQQVYVEIAQKGFEAALSIGATLVALYTKCCLFPEACEVFNKLPEKDVVSWTTLISGYAEKGQGQEALEVFERMKQEGKAPNAHTYASILKACNILNAVEKGQEIHKEIRQNGYESNLYVGSALVDFYAQCGFLSEAWEAFDQLSVRDVVVWTTLIAGSADHGRGQDGLECFDKMRREGILPTAITFACVLKACGTIKAIDRGRELHIEIESKALSQGDPSVGNSLITMYAKCGSLADAQYVFDRLQARNTVSWNALITGYSEHGSWQGAVECFDRMCKTGDSPNAVTYAGVFKACSTPEALEKGSEIHGQIFGCEIEKDLSISNSLIGMYAKCGSFREAGEVFDKISSRDIVTWNALIAGYTSHGLNQQVLDCFHKLQSEALSPDSATFSCVLRACGSIGAIDVGREVHAEILSRGHCTGDPSIRKGLITMYAACGSFPEAQLEFEKLSLRDATAWSLMMKCAGINHKGKIAIQYFEDMLVQGVSPDAITFTCLLTACCHSSLVDEGKHYFKMMKQDFHVTPTAQHYNCVVNLISRTGLLYDAERFLEMLGCTSEETWSSILNACKTYGEVELGLRCFEQLIQINAEDSAWYVLMEDVYAVAGKWGDPCKFEDLRKYVNARKLAAVASIEVAKNVHDFVVGDEPNEELLSLLNELNLRMKKKGHVPHLDLASKVQSDGEKEAALCVHAEKLAIAFGLLNTPQGTTLRVSKNLRMCFECHSTSKLISKVERREIILRDSCCVHHFKDNACSCGDMF